MWANKLVEEIRAFLICARGVAMSDPDFEATLLTVTIPDRRGWPTSGNEHDRKLSQFVQTLGLPNARELSGRHLRGVEFWMLHRGCAPLDSNGNGTPVLEIRLQFESPDEIRSREGIGRDIVDFLELINQSSDPGFVVDWYIGNDSFATDGDPGAGHPVWLNRY